MNANNNFDASIRSMLKDAEVKAPSGVWKAVSSRLEEKPAFRWGWVAAPLAFATIALGIFLFRTSPEPTNNIQSRLALSGEPAVLNISEPAGTFIRKDFPVKVSAAKPEPSVPETTDASRSEIEQREIPQPRQESQTAASTPTSPEKTSPTQPVADPFAALEMEEKLARKSSRLALSFGGTISGSENKRSMIGSRTSGITSKSLENQILETSTSTFGIPFTIGVGVRYYFSNRFSVGSGVDFSLLTRTFTGQYTPNGGSMSEGDITHTMVYLGIPLDLHFDIINSRIAKFYAFGGGEFEYAVSNRYNIRSIDKILREKVSGPQLSVGGGLGVEFKIGRILGIYLDPGVNYYFNTNQPKSVRTERPLMFNLDAGVRFNF